MIISVIKTLSESKQKEVLEGIIKLLGKLQNKDLQTRVKSIILLQKLIKIKILFVHPVII
ncbi:hypothetical protein AGJ45_21180 [Cronobacter dublinensis subsp. dublinensis]|nr:hypothetical protein [Cronobacter dublinensis subsp. dublinensis]EGT5688122.1 hypothetical protein [Cronobacter dublinensis subsp. dublinensis]EGT5700544.1 hypothetical protein [Cronobacter dublinensis subsp. dublinensis]